MTIDRRKFIHSAGAAAFALNLTEIRQSTAAACEELQQAQQDDLDLQSLRAQFSLDANVNYLNHAAIGAMPIPVQNARQKYLQICEQNPWLYMWGGAWEQPREGVRSAAAKFLGCTSGEIAITHNTTELFNVLAQGLPLGRGDEVLFSSLNHSGASVAFQQFSAGRGYKVRQFEFPAERTWDLNSDRVLQIYAEQITPATKLLVFPHIDNTIGLRYPAQAMTAMAKSAGVEFVAIDGAQSVGTLPINLKELGVDAYATSGHKWLGGPKGIGLAFISDALQASLKPLWVTWGQKQWQGSARAFEDYGTRNLPELLALGDAITFHRAIADRQRQNEMSRLREHVMKRAHELGDEAYASPRDHQCSSVVMSIQLPKSAGDANTVAKNMFKDQQIVVRPFRSKHRNAIRLSPNIYTTIKEIDACFDFIKNG